MRKKLSSLPMALLLGSLLALTACASTQGDKTNKTVANIASIKFSLPKQIKWKQIKSTTKNGNNLTEWIPENSTDKNTLIRVFYQRSTPVQSTADYTANIIKAIQQICTDIKVTPFKITSTYTNRSNNEILCAQLVKNKFGTVSHVSVFSDNNANYALVSEVKTLESKKAGIVNYQNAQEKQRIQNSITLAKLMYQTHNNIRICNAAKECL
ncbi:MAG: hypothetical protein ACWIPH_02960 [Ostreibacterium sp.]